MYFSRWKASRKRKKVVTRGHDMREERSRGNPKPVKRDFAFAFAFTLSLSFYISPFSLDSSRRNVGFNFNNFNFRLLGIAPIYGFSLSDCALATHPHILYISSFHIYDRLSCSYLIDKQAPDTLVILIKFAIVCKLPFSSLLINKSN